MERLIPQLRMISDTMFPFLRYRNLSEYVYYVSRDCSIPFSAHLTDSNRKYLRYRCSFHESEKCQSFLIFRKDIFGNITTYTFIESISNLVHNHSINPIFANAHRNCIPIDVQLKIQEQQQIGVFPGRIRSNLGVTTNSNIFYNIRRPIIAKQRSETLKQIISHIHSSKNKEIIIHENEETNDLSSFIVVYSHVKNSDYYYDVVIADDTAATNIYNLPVEIVTCIDQESHTQLLSYGLLEDKTTNSFIQFFEDLRQITNNQSINTFIVDRLSAQKAAIKYVYPESNIVFCLNHIERDLIKNFGESSGIVEGFRIILKNYSLCEEYIYFLATEVARFKKENKNGWRALQDLINQREYWLPSDLIRKGIHVKFTSNRAENFFGLFKQNYGYTQRTIIQLMDDIDNMAHVFLTQSISVQNKKSKEFSSKLLPFILLNEINQFGSMILEILHEEYIAWAKNEREDFCCWCYLRNKNSPYKIPCRHTMNSQFIIFANSVHRRYLRNNNYQIDKAAELKIFRTAKDRNKEFQYNNIIGRIAPYASVAYKNEHIQNIFSRMFKELEQTKVPINDNMPSVTITKGRKFVSPAKNVIPGKSKNKKQYCCSICGELGHNSQRCHLKNSNE